MRLGWIDWTTLLLYLAVVVTLGVLANRRGRGRADWFFLGGRSVPAWAVAMSFVGTAISVVTVTGVPESAYHGDLTYLAVVISQMIAAVIVAFWFLPVYYRSGVSSIYDLLESRLGAEARVGASWLFLIGRVLANGVRLYIAAIPVAMMLFSSDESGVVDDAWVAVAVVAIAVIATAYTMAGGISAVIWTDVAQVIVLAGAALLSIWLVLDRLGMTPVEAYRIIEAAGTGSGGSKLRVFDTSGGIASDFSVLSVLTAMAVFHLAAFGTDQDMVQRLLTCKDSKRAARSIIGSIVLMGCVIGLFLIVGLLLFVYYRPDAPRLSAHPAPTGAKAFASFVLHELPLGVRGLVFAGIIAAAMSSLDSALTAMASVGASRDSQRERGARKRVVLWACALTACALIFTFLAPVGDRGLISFALGVMTYPYAGLLGVFLAVLFTRRGNAGSAVAAMAIGPAVVLALEFGPRMLRMDEFLISAPLAYPWRLCIGAAVALAVCVAGRRRQCSALPSAPA